MRVYICIVNDMGHINSPPIKCSRVSLTWENGDFQCRGMVMLNVLAVALSYLIYLIFLLSVKCIMHYERLKLFHG